MNRLPKRLVKSVVIGSVLLVGAGSFLSSFLSSEASPPQDAPAGAGPEEARIPVFSAPSHLPAGEQWMIVGSPEELPADLGFSSPGARAAVLETQVLSDRAVAVRLQVPAAADGNLLQANSARGRLADELPVRVGQVVPALAAAANYTDEDLVEDALVVKGDRFVYGYLPATEGGLGAVRIHNRRTGRWHSREHDFERALAAQAASEAEPLPAFFEEVDPLETLPDTDGDGIPDFDEDPEPKAPTPDFLGVRLVPGENTLDIVCVDEHGNSSWRVLKVLSNFQPASAEQ